jgi:SAM-dependent methyltransferase
MIESEQEYIKMNNVEQSHWWYKSLHYLVLKNITNISPDKKIKILDAGCGTGGLLAYLKHKGYANIGGFDISKDAVKFSNNKDLNVRELDLKEFKYTSKKYDVIISNDTMYFFDLQEQRKILNNFYNSLNDGGCVILNFPSFDIFSGIHDKAVGIKKRFTFELIAKIIDRDKFVVINKRYWPMTLSPVILLVRIFQKLELFINDNIEIKSDIKRPSRFINNILLHLVKFEVDNIPGKLFSSSLFLVLKKID